MQEYKETLGQKYHVCARESCGKDLSFENKSVLEKEKICELFLSISVLL